jgi:hypothetical protein
LIVSAVVLLLSYRGVGQEAGSALQQAAEAYAAGDFGRAVALYEAVVQSGVRDGAVYFNLGNAYYESGDLGRALLNYRRAQELLPRDSDVEANIALVRSRRIDLQGDETALVDSVAALSEGIATISELSLLLFALWIAWCGVLAARIMRPRWQESLRIPLLTLSALLVVGAVVVGCRLYVTYARPAAVVISDTVPVMSGPGDSYLEHFELHSAAELRVVEARNGWVRFSLPDGREGWIKVETITPI